MFGGDRLYYIILKFHARIKEHLDMEGNGHAYDDDDGDDDVDDDDDDNCVHERVANREC